MDYIDDRKLMVESQNCTRQYVIYDERGEVGVVDGCYLCDVWFCWVL